LLDLSFALQPSSQFGQHVFDRLLIASMEGLPMVTFFMGYKLLCSYLCFQQRLGLLQVSGVKALGEPAINRRQELTGLFLLPLALP
jgi:hypothetical protein